MRCGLRSRLYEVCEGWGQAEEMEVDPRSSEVQAAPM